MCCVSRAVSLCCVGAAVSSAVVAMVINPSIASATKRAMELSTRANIDPSFADDACRMWDSILCTEESPLPLSAMSAAHALFGTTLARVGRDREALVQYDKSLVFFDKSSKESKQKILSKAEADVLIAKSKSLQRLMKYRDAIAVLNDVSSRCNESHAQRIESVERAAICSMRMGDIDLAICILDDFETSMQNDVRNANVGGMLGACLLLTLTKEQHDETYQKALQLIQYASACSVSPIFNWIHHFITSREDFNPFESFKDIFVFSAEVNNSPFDDPDLIHLDDKVRLHSLIKKHETFCPSGYVLPQEIGILEREWKNEGDSDRLAWMLKDGAGYGSHGNLVATLTEVLKMYNSSKNADEHEESKLCQRVVHPPMLLNGHKFSLRVYVVYFPEGDILLLKETQRLGSEVHVSTEGLVKFASAAYSDETIDNIDDRFMTNSGRGDGRSSKQEDFVYLRKQFVKNDIDFLIMWEKIRKSIKVVFSRYSTLKQQLVDDNTSSPLAFFGLPKILGFDFLLSASGSPWLLEVNRFPGLDPRSSSDSRVKRSVQYDAWVVATHRMGLSTEHMKKFCPPNYSGFSLEKLN